MCGGRWAGAGAWGVAFPAASLAGSGSGSGNGADRETETGTGCYRGNPGRGTVNPAAAGPRAGNPVCGAGIPVCGQ